MGELQTFLFMDMVGFTALTAEHGDDRAAEVAYLMFGHVRRLLSDHRAQEIKTIGDAMMVRCEDPALAVALGVRIVDELDESGPIPPLRVGVHTGTAVEREGDWYGAGVNVAARLCSAAGGGEVLVSESTRSAAGPVPEVDLGSRTLHWLKNVPEPVAAWPAVAAPISAPVAVVVREPELVRPAAKLRAKAVALRERVIPAPDCGRGATGAMV
jgi:class 3 adenylate cyclase